MKFSEYVGDSQYDTRFAGIPVKSCTVQDNGRITLFGANGRSVAENVLDPEMSGRVAGYFERKLYTVPMTLQAIRGTSREKFKPGYGHDAAFAKDKPKQLPKPDRAPTPSYQFGEDEDF